MKLLIVTNLFPNSQEPTRGMYNLQQFRELAKLCEIKVVAPVAWYRFSDVTEKENIDSIEVCHPRYFMTPKIGRSLYGLFFYLSLRGKVKKVYRDFKFDAILATWAYPDGYGSYLIAKAMQKPIVIKAHGTDINSYLKYYWRRRMIARALKGCSKVITVTKGLKDKIVGVGVPQDKVEVIYNGVDTDLFKPMDLAECRRAFSLPLQSKIILYVGNFSQGKGIEDLITAFSKISAKGDDYLLVLAGDGDLKPSLARQVEKFGLKDKVRFTGRLAHEKIAVLMNACDIFCIPSLNEGCSNVTLEALACGKPVIGTNVEGIPELVTSDDLGILVEPRNPEALAAAIIAGLNSKWNAEKIRQSVSKFSWQKGAERINVILKDIYLCRGRACPAPTASMVVWKRALKSVIIFLTPQKMILWKGKAKSNKIALTFDDGPNARFTSDVLEILKSKGVRATFFVLGNAVEKNADIAASIIGLGHSIGEHSYSHRDPRGLAPEERRREAQRPREILKEKLRINSHLFRPPRGRLSISRLIDCARQGVTTVMWSVDSQDYCCQDSHKIIERVTANGIEGGDIVLFHDDNEATLKALPEIIDRLRAKGFEFATVEEILE